MYRPIPSCPPPPKRIRGDHVREARPRYETGDWRAWPDADESEQPTATADDQGQNES
ncbi:hypothetical protein [Kitasatospora sp. HPMI-4]|uniref:hypothetical protein n=1 Tax=Kitasatospora sp. HPMI-4 TaxID=3448443 RepID=UPI003F1D5802